MNKSHAFEERIRSLLDESSEAVAPDIARKLQLARHAALEKARPQTPVWLMPRAIAAGLLLAVISAGVWYKSAQDTVPPDTLLAMETELELLGTDDNLELMEDLEFMQWLVETQGYAG